MAIIVLEKIIIDFVALCHIRFILEKFTFSLAKARKFYEDGRNQGFTEKTMLVLYIIAKPMPSARLFLADIVACADSGDIPVSRKPIYSLRLLQLRMSDMIINIATTQTPRTI